MRTISFLLFVAAASLPQSASSLTVSPSAASVYARAGSKAELRCLASAEVSSCIWTTPSGSTYTLGEGQVAQAGRLARAEGAGADCGVVVNGVEPEDEGEWKCIVNAVNGAEVTEAASSASLVLAKSPDFVSVANTTSRLPVGRASPFRCVAANASLPEPAFAWFVDGEELTGHETMVDRTDLDEEGRLFDFGHTLHFVPSMEHDNGSLRCVVTHAGETFEDELALSLSNEDHDLADFIRPEEVMDSDSDEADDDEDGEGVSEVVIIAVAAVGAIVALIVLVLVAFKIRSFLRSSDSSRSEPLTNDAEAGLDAPTKEDEADSKETSEAANKPSLRQRLTAFFCCECCSCRRKKVADGGGSSDTSEVNTEKADIDNDNKDEETEQTEKTEIPATEESKSSEKTAVTKKFLSWFKRSNATADVETAEDNKAGEVNEEFKPEAEEKTTTEEEKETEVVAEAVTEEEEKKEKPGPHGTEV